jgi:hypothetical protein
MLLGIIKRGAVKSVPGYERAEPEPAEQMPLVRP